MQRKASIPAVLAIVTALLVAAAGRAEALSYISLEMSQLLVWNPEDAGEVSPVLIWAPGVVLPIIEKGAFRLELGALFWGTQYEYLSDTGRMVPTQIETASQIGVLGLLLTPLAGFHVAVAGGKIELGAAVGPTLNLRFPLYQTDVEEGGTTDIGSAYKYFWAGRFLFPESRLWIRWYAFDDLALSLSVSALYPIFHIWDGNVFADQFTVAVVAGFDLRLPRKKAAPATEPAAQTPAVAPPAEEAPATDTPAAQTPAGAEPAEQAPAEESAP